MGILERKKPYKACDPWTTIEQLRKTLWECDIFTIEQHFSYPHSGMYCCRLTLGDEEFAPLNLGTNGKGLNARYALASAYGELLERLQNHVLFPPRQSAFATRRYLDQDPAMAIFRQRLENEDLILDFQYGPEEVYLDAGELAENCADVLQDMLGLPSSQEQRQFLGAALGTEKMACLPYFSVFENKTRILPVQMIWNYCGTNGMCAGNTPEEAILQGISEVLERYVIRVIYEETLTPPSIPVQWFGNTAVSDHLAALQSSGYEVIIKDCSLGKGLPVIGLLLINTGKSCYTFHLGADPSPITALERCLSEIFQGSPADVAEKFQPLPVHGEANAAAWNPASKNMRQAYEATVMAGTGVWPSSIFEEQPSYSFAGFEHPDSISDRDDLEWILRKSAEVASNLFVRDVSFLGFPCYQVFIPGLSETSFLWPDDRYDQWMEAFRRHRTLLNIPNADQEDVVQLAKTFSTQSEHGNRSSLEPKRWFLSSIQAEWQELTLDELLFILFGSAGHHKEAAESLASFLESSAAQTSPLRYLRAVHDYLSFRCQNLSRDEIHSSLIAKYGEILTEKVIENFSSRDRIISQIPLPSCFDCDACSVRQSCRYLQVLRTVKSLQTLHTANLPRQSDLSKLFANIHAQVPTPTQKG